MMKKLRYKLCPKEEFAKMVSDKLYGITHGLYYLPLSDLYYHKIYANRQGGHFKRLRDADNTLCFEQCDYDYGSSENGNSIVVAKGVIVDMLYSNDKPAAYDSYYNRQYNLAKAKRAEESGKPLTEDDFVRYHLQREKELYDQSKGVFNYFLEEDKGVIRNIVKEYLACVKRRRLLLLNRKL